ncbi:MAG: YitT family protein [Erysipelotrichaceae bacterium]|nr:YitT family protein [Erysipelotrichaceae bacterium]
MKNKLLDILGVLFGNFLLAVSVAYFVLPFDILSGGVAGISIITRKLWNISTTLMIDILVIGLFIVGAFVLGKEFALKTALSSFVYPVFLEILVRFPVKLEIDMLMSCIFGGLIAGAGVGIAFRYNASTGGTDIIALTANKYLNVPVSTAVMITDGIITLLGVLTFGLQDVLMGIVYIYASSLAINKAMVPKTDEAVALYIITDKKKEICDYIHIDLFRGTTILQGRGGYTEQERDIILTVVSKSQYMKLSHFVEKTDPYAFVIVSDAKEIKGEGFTYE